jgi:7-cyano-7-deazaguanine synthase
VFDGYSSVINTHRVFVSKGHRKPGFFTREMMQSIISVHNTEGGTMKALVLLSGGVDSTTCLGLAVDQYGKENVIALSMSYGQKHTKELEVSKKIAAHYQVEAIYLDLAGIFVYSECSLLEHSKEEIPKEDYAAQLKKSNGKPVSTYVPFRNGLFLSSAASIALSKGCSIIYYGAHSDDAAGNAYPDCSAAFNQAMNEAIYEGSGKQLQIKAPFVSWTKAEVVKKGIELNVPYEFTWSCYEGGDRPCQTCGTCIDRAKAFELNGILDPAL